MKTLSDTYSAAQSRPLVVDLDGTLIETDMLHESYFGTVTRGLRHHWSLLAALLRGKAPLKAFLAEAGAIDYALLPYNEAVLNLIRRAHAEGRPIYLATASDRRHAEGVADHLGLFSGVFASDGTTNLSGKTKASKLVEAFGEEGFDYVGDGAVDMGVWSEAHGGYAVGVAPRLARKIDRLGIPVEHLKRRRASLRVWLKAIRVHQYAKNVLVFVPLLTAHAYSLSALLKAGGAFAAFSLCASAVYILNDLIDLDADRRHPTKRRRPFASGAIPILHGVAAIPALLLLAYAGAFWISPLLAAVLTVYLFFTLAYSFSFKRKLLLDVVVLAILYTVRVIGGAVALPVTVSEWLLAFSMFMFTCLALIKRQTELAVRFDNGLPDPSNRNYKLADLPIIPALAAAAGFNAVTIFTLYISSAPVGVLYRRPEILWLICPILLYWIGRIIALAHRRLIDDDPIVFALKDRISYIAGALMIGLVLLAT